MIKQHEQLNRRLQRTLIAPTTSAALLRFYPFQHDWRSKSELLLWLADAVWAIAAECLLGHRKEYHERLEAAGFIEVIARRHASAPAPVLV